MRRYVLPPLPASSITPESVWLDRRRLVAALAATPLLGLAGCARAEQEADRPAATDAALAPESVPDGVFRTAEEQTRYQDATSYNNFYEFGTDKADPGKYAYRLQTSPWSVQVTGHVETTGSFALEDLLKPHTAQERIYRLRCVEGWSMVIPWSGIPLGEVLARFKPTSKAKYVAFTTLADKETMRGLRYRSIDWPYVEGLRIDEAMHPLTLLATGMYGRELANQNGAPLRLIVPWKYGFKSIKSIVKIDFVEEMPPTSWNELQASEYGFYSNVNPDVDHPRWSQKTERRLSGSGSRVFADRIPTLPFNGYGEQVASLYTGMDLRKWY